MCSNSHGAKSNIQIIPTMKYLKIAEIRTTDYDILAKNRFHLCGKSVFNALQLFIIENGGRGAMSYYLSPACLNLLHFIPVL